MNLKLVAVISLFAAVPMVAFAQKDEPANKAPKPTVADVLKHSYAPSPVDVVYPEDYTGLP